MAEGKWISDLTPTMHLHEAARVVLLARYKAVRHYLPLAIDAAAKDVEHVHQLRVACRRAAAGLRLFESCLPDKRASRNVVCCAVYDGPPAKPAMPTSSLKCCKALLSLVRLLPGLQNIF